MLKHGDISWTLETKYFVVYIYNNITNIKIDNMYKGIQ